MTNTDAVQLVIQFMTEFQEFLKIENSGESKKVLADRILGWALIRQLAPAAELVAKAWLESSPQSHEARQALVNYLYVVGRPSEAAVIEEGGGDQRMLRNLRS